MFCVLIVYFIMLWTRICIILVSYSANVCLCKQTNNSHKSNFIEQKEPMTWEDMNHIWREHGGRQGSNPETDLVGALKSTGNNALDTLLKMGINGQ